jgi:hypothetical protein
MTAAGVVILFGLAGCGQRQKVAEKRSAAVVASLNQGRCQDPIAGVDPAAWNRLCTAVRAAMAEGTTITLDATTVHDSGEIGHDYTSLATIIGRDGAEQTLSLYYRGTGFSGSDPQLSYVTLDRRVLFER